MLKSPRPLEQARVPISTMQQSYPGSSIGLLVLPETASFATHQRLFSAEQHCLFMAAKPMRSCRQREIFQLPITHDIASSKKIDYTFKDFVVDVRSVHNAFHIAGNILRLSRCKSAVLSYKALYTRSYLHAPQNVIGNKTPNNMLCSLSSVMTASTLFSYHFIETNKSFNTSPFTLQGLFY